MDAPIPCIEPDSITAGDSATWERSFQFYSAANGWTLSYALSNREKGGEAIKFESTPDGDKHLISLTAAFTAAWPAADYIGQGYVTKGLERRCVWVGVLRVLPNLAAGNLGDQRSHARIVLDNIETVLEKRATQQNFEYTVEGVALRKLKHSELLLLADRYRAIVASERDAERIAAGKPTGRRILTRFIKPS